MFLQFFNQMIKTFTHQQLCGIRGHRTCKDEVQFPIFLTLTDYILHIICFTGQIISQPHPTTRISKQTAQRTFPNIHINQNDFFIHLRNTHSQITRNKGLSCSRIRGSKHHHLQIFRFNTHKIHICTDYAESFRHRVSPVLMYNNLTTLFPFLGLITIFGNIAQ